MTTAPSWAAPPARRGRGYRGQHRKPRPVDSWWTRAADWWFLTPERVVSWRAVVVDWWAATPYRALAVRAWLRGWWALARRPYRRSRLRSLHLRFPDADGSISVVVPTEAFEDVLHASGSGRCGPTTTTDHHFTQGGP